MKKKGLLLSVGAALVIGAGAGLFTAINQSGLETRAASPSSNMDFFVDVSGVASTSFITNAQALYAFACDAEGDNPPANQFIALTAETESFYSFVLPAKYTKIVIVGTNDGNVPDNTWSNKTGQTVDVNWSDAFNTISIGNTTNGEGKYNVSTYWTWNESISGSNANRAVANGTNRYWFYADDEVWGGNANLAIRVHGGTSDGNFFMCPHIKNTNESTGRDVNALYYADLPSDATYIEVMRTNPTVLQNGKTIIWNSTDPWINLSNTGWVSPFKMHKIYFSNTKLTVSEMAYSGTFAPSSLANILQEFPTCTITAAQVLDIYSSFISKATGDLTSAHLAADFVRSEYIVDESYTGLTQKADSQPTVQEKWEALCERVGANPANGTVPSGLSQSIATNSVSDNGTWAIAIIAGAALAATGGYFFLRRRKEN